MSNKFNQSTNIFQNPDKPTCIDLILTNRPNLFQHTSALEIGLSDFHLLTVTEFKMRFQKLKPKIIAYRDYKEGIEKERMEWQAPKRYISIRFY